MAFLTNSVIGLWPLLLPIAAWSGWMIGRRDKNRYSRKSSQNLSHDYIVGLNYLLNEQPDKAVDVFIRLLDVDNDTVETHLALGNLFRRRGEVERAIRIHQNLIARPQLQRSQRVQALMELGRDYMSAGVFDRAERLFLEVVELGGEQTGLSLHALLDIYQQEKDWARAIEVAQKIEAVSAISMRTPIAHYYCELAEIAVAKISNEQALRYIKRAQSANRDCARASLLFGKLEAKEGRDKSAIRAFRQAIQQDPDIISEVLPGLIASYDRIKQPEELVQYLRICLVEHPRIGLVLELSERLKHNYSVASAAKFVAEQLRTRPSLRGLHRLIELQLESAEGALKSELQTLHHLTGALLEHKPIYQCGQCGFSGKKMHWQCPSCREWDTVKPIHGLEGD